MSPIENSTKKFFMIDNNEIELMQSKDTGKNILQCWNLSQAKCYDNDYCISLYIKSSEKSIYSYYNDLDDMFIIYDMLVRI